MRFLDLFLRSCGLLMALSSLLLLMNAGKNLIFRRSYRSLNFTDACQDCDCPGVLHGDRKAALNARILNIKEEFREKILVQDEFYIEAAQDCRKFKSTRKYFTFPLSKEEKDFPIAFSIVVHHKMQNFEHLLRAIYAPQNFYCVHVDRKSPPSFRAAVTAVASCFPNVFLASRTEEVVYASWSRVQADINCMQDLYQVSAGWKYLVNLCGQDFPLKTNLEMVRALRALDGRNSLESEMMRREKLWRISHVHTVTDGKVKVTRRIKQAPPLNLTIFSGNAYIVVCRGFVRSVLQDGRVKVLMDWAQDTFSPDEFIWATVQRMRGVPGSTWLSVKHDMSDLNAIARMVKWQAHEGPPDSRAAVYPACEGRHVRDICVYGAGDVHWLLRQHHCFANKFDLEVDAVAVFCLEKYLRKKALFP